jgi:hypothetical protein
MIEFFEEVSENLTSGDWADEEIISSGYSKEWPMVCMIFSIVGMIILYFISLGSIFINPLDCLTYLTIHFPWIYKAMLVSAIISTVFGLAAGRASEKYQKHHEKRRLFTFHMWLFYLVSVGGWICIVITCVVLFVNFIIDSIDNVILKATEPKKVKPENTKSTINQYNKFLKN